MYEIAALVPANSFFYFSTNKGIQNDLAYQNRPNCKIVKSSPQPKIFSIARFVFRFFVLSQLKQHRAFSNAVKMHQTCHFLSVRQLRGKPFWLDSQNRNFHRKAAFSFNHRIFFIGMGWLPEWLGLGCGLRRPGFESRRWHN